ncbi:MAG: slipin family protein [Firmicutes bacterium]|jgi:regulator of protease activity HflC (stomatin/prohibitin superfamily)|nr:slipin family protein [Candidatus Fermentithermobacillaceae bacterium]
MWIATISLAVKRKDSFVALIHGAMGALTFLVSIWFPTIGSVCSLILIVIMLTSYRVIREYTRGVAFRLGKLKGVLEAGITVIAPFGIDQIKIVDIRTFTIDVPKQEVITKDNVPVVVDAVVYFNVFDSILAVTQVADYVKTTSLLGQTTLRSILGQHELDELLSKRSELNEILRRLLDEATDPWGIRISMVEMKSIELPDSMKRAMARQAEAERDRRAQVIAAEGELQASEKLAEAARIMAQAPVSVQLRFLHTLSEIASEQNSTIVFPIPLPMDIIGMVGGLTKKDQ